MSNKSHFFAHLARLKLINRWPLMHNMRTENVQEHSLQVAMVAHALALIKNKFFGGAINAERIATIAMFHYVSEVLTAINSHLLISVRLTVNSYSTKNVHH